MLLDFKEIPQANISDGNQDTFEFFARDLFVSLGFTIVSDIGRGNDDRKDIIISEKIQGTVASHEKRYLVSCKHYSKSAKSVGNGDEPDILGRLRNNNCDGFIGFYSTIASSALVREIENLQQNNTGINMSVDFIDKARITTLLQENNGTLKVFKKYLPLSYDLHITNEIKSGIYKKEPEIYCHICRFNILLDLKGSIIKIGKYERSHNHFTNRETGHSFIYDIVFSCSSCKDEVKNKIKEKYGNDCDIYCKDIVNYTNPKYFIRDTLEEVKFSSVYTGYFKDIGVFRIWNIFTRSMFYYVSRKYNDEIQANTAPRLPPLGNREEYKL